MILVTGATGLVGANLLLKLSEKRGKIRALYRSDDKREQVKRFFEANSAGQYWDRIEWVKGDVLSIPDLEDSIRDIKVVYHCAAMVSFEPKHRKQMHKVNVEGTANMVNVALKHDVDYFCHVSSVAALGTNKGGEASNEESPFDVEKKQSHYAYTKYLSELEVWRGQHEGLNCGIVNPSIILSDYFWENSSGSMIPMVAKGLPYHTPGSTGFVWVEDLVKVMMQLEAERISGERFVVNGENLAYRDFFARVAHRLGVKSPQRALPIVLGRIACTLDAMRSKLFGTPRRLSKEALLASYRRRSYDARKAEDMLNMRFTSIDTVLDKLCASYKKEQLN